MSPQVYCTVCKNFRRVAESDGIQEVEVLEIFEGPQGEDRVSFKCLVCNTDGQESPVRAGVFNNG